MCCASLTFDQPLYLKSYKIKQNNHPEFKHINLRLGGFHQLMSFLGAGCKLMEGSGIEDLWATVYARGSLPKMMEGKAYTKCIRASLLTDAALHLTLLKSTTNSESEVELFDDITDMLEDFPQTDMEGTYPSEPNNDETTLPNPTEITIMTESQSSGGVVHSIADARSENTEHMLGGDLSRRLEELYDNLVKQVISPDQMEGNVCMTELLAHVNNLKETQKSSRTGKLWLQFTEFVSIVQMFIRSERIGDWDLYLKATQDMLPFFAAAGHNNYAKCVRLYLQVAMVCALAFKKRWMMVGLLYGEMLTYVGVGPGQI